MELQKYKKDIVARLYKGTFIVLLMSMLATTIGNVIDGIIIGKNLGADAMAAFGFTTPLQKFVAILPNVLVLGMQILCSQKLGKGKLQEAIGAFSLSISVAGILSILFMIIFFALPGQIADWLGADESFGVIRAETIDYFQAYSLGLPAIAAVTLLTPIMQLDSDRQRSVKAVTILSATNVIGDLIVIFYFGGGMWGIGISTAVSYWLSFAFLLLHFRNPNATFKFSVADIKISDLGEIFLNGLPIALGRGASMLQSGFLNYIALNSGGAAGVAAVAIFNNIFSMVESVPKAIASTAQIISGIFIGEKDKKAILRLLRISLRSSALVSVTMFVILILGAPIISGFYTSGNDSAVFDMVVEGVHCMAFSVIFSTGASLLQYFYQAYGRFKLVSFMAVANNIIFIAPLALILTPIFGMTGVWLTILFNNVLFFIAIILGVWYHYKKITFKPEDMLLLPQNFGSPENPQMNMSVTFKDDDLSISEVVKVFLEKHNVSRKKTMFTAICVEEMVNNILEYGFDENNKNSIDIRIIIQGDEVTIRIRDDCRPFNPKKWYEVYNPEDLTAHIGIRLVAKMAKEIQYVNVLKLNNLIIKI
ncbi:MAG: ATP-binding protein [Selenomonadaceae bacterium]|nr:ATP-binding protein [Selenomonadaceae bacterium]